MAEIRRNVVDGRLTLLAPERRRRPREARPPEARGKRPPFSADCPFCPGNEADLAPLVAEFADGETAPWQTRVVLNKYPIVGDDSASAEPLAWPFLSSGLGGRHEVIIETPRHDTDLALEPVDHVERVINAYLARYRALEPAYPHIVTFRNHGPHGGASLAHPHSQLVALEQPMPEMERRLRLAQDHFADTNRCLLCDVIAAERNAASRMVRESRDFVAFVPFAAEVPCELWLAPRRHQPCFTDITEAEAVDFAVTLKDCLGRLRIKAEDPAYNLMLLSHARSGPPSALHWLVRIRPRLTMPAGFEIAAGFTINTSLPEDDARLLRKA